MGRAVDNSTLDQWRGLEAVELCEIPISRGATPSLCRGNASERQWREPGANLRCTAGAIRPSASTPLNIHELISRHRIARVCRFTSDTGSRPVALSPLTPTRVRQNAARTRRSKPSFNFSSGDPFEPRNRRPERKATATGRPDLPRAHRRVRDAHYGEALAGISHRRASQLVLALAKPSNQLVRVWRLGCHRDAVV